jgi:hypothetical protein
MVAWESIPLWRLQRLDGCYVAKVNLTSVHTHVSATQADANVRLETHSTSNNRLIGYVLRTKRRPEYYEGPFFLGVFYSAMPLSSVPDMRKPISILYHDCNVRLLAFGDDEKRRDYMLVLRTKPQES